MRYLKRWWIMIASAIIILLFAAAPTAWHFVAARVSVPEVITPEALRVSPGAMITRYSATLKGGLQFIRPEDIETDPVMFRGTTFTLVMWFLTLRNDCELSEGHLWIIDSKGRKFELTWPKNIVISAEKGPVVLPFELELSDEVSPGLSLMHARLVYSCQGVDVVHAFPATQFEVR